ncbi:MAG TPA: UDP-N-acetylmuramoyl-L-alanine--D-glutamate ligase [Clostridia bacterium]|nr:UDP-N-acetylmuramoyl-L-alanine--D-glutamate ligase [Clostridia bacterium]HPO53412.1 UDP-N-acetylmuramoyl-L-alanine--D-glutamate ligase [Clostridia bacterium]
MKNVLVMGMQTSGISVSTLLEKNGYNVRIYDDRLELKNNWRNRGTEALDGLAFIIISPGIPNSHPIVAEAIKRNIPIISELDYGANMLDAEKIMVTGTNGKTTTVDMINKGISIMGKKSMAMGNIGYPVSQVVLDGTELEYAVIEASSFQLEYTSNIKAKVAALLNLAPDHLDRYASFEAYVEAKKRVFLNQDKSDFAILNYDSRTMREIAKTLPSTVLWVSHRENIGEVYVKDNYYYYQGEPLISARECRAKGEHNRFNMMVALNTMAVLGARKDQMISLIRDYKLLPHRIEYVSTIDNKTFYNDSKGTNIAACKAAIDSVAGKVGLILGGSDKHEEFCEFFDDLDPKVMFVAVTGANDEKIYSAAMKVGFQNIKICPTLKDAIRMLYSMEGIDTILFSPACASFDRYSSYVERGNNFKDLVYALKG